MNTRASTQFVVFAMGNGVAAAMSVAAALRGRWMETAVCVALSWACAGGILGAIGMRAQSHNPHLPKAADVGHHRD